MPKSQGPRYQPIHSLVEKVARRADARTPVNARSHDDQASSKHLSATGDAGAGQRKETEKMSDTLQRSGEDSIKGKDKEKHNRAKVLVNQLVLVLENRRRQARDNSMWSKRTEAHTNRLVEIATGPEAAVKPYLGLLPRQWFSDVKKLQKSTETHTRLNIQLHQCQTNLDQAADAFDATISTLHTVLDAPDDDRWPQAAEQLEQEISAANDLDKIDANVALAQADVDDARLDEEAAIQSILRMAEAALVKIGLMRPLKKT